MKLVIGPTNAGKSTWIDRNYGGEVGFAFQFAKNSLLGKSSIPQKGTLLHYNLLFLAGARQKRKKSLVEWDVLDDTLLARCLKSGQVEQAIVIVAPIAQLKSRASIRTDSEKELSQTGDYKSAYWATVLDSVNLFAMYQRLFDALERYKVPYQILYNSDDNPSDEMPETDRCYVHAALRGTYVPIPSEEEVEAACALPEAEYQSVLLPRGRQSSGDYSHTKGTRRQSFDIFRDQSLAERSVLDIGCAMGDMLFWYERFGAAKMTGIDIREGRLSAARKFGELLNSKAKFIYGNFLERDDIDTHDDVLALNVIHHVPDIRGFLERASQLANKRVIIEYPTLYDRKFLQLGRIPSGLNRYALIGVSTSRMDQTFVFSDTALIRLMSEYGDFDVDIRKSPMKRRRIAVFTKK